MKNITASFEKIISSCSLLTFLFALFLTGCSVTVPVADLETPETLGTGGLKLGLFEGTAPSFSGTMLLNGSPYKPSNDVNNSASGSGIFTTSLALGVYKGLDLGVESFTTTNLGSSSSFFAKYQWFGDSLFFAEKNNTSMSTKIKFISYSNRRNKINKPESSGFYDITHTYGSRWTQSLGWYVGGKVINGSINVDYYSDDGLTFINRNSRNVTIVGGLGGLHWSPHHNKFNFSTILELQLMNIPNYGTEERTFAYFMGFGFSLGMNFFNPSTAPTPESPAAPLPLLQ